MFRDMELRPIYPLQILPLPAQKNDEPRPANRIARRRRALKLTQQQVADYVGVTQKAVQNWESGKNRPQGPKLQRLSHILKIPIGDLLEDDPDLSQLDRIEVLLTRIARELGVWTGELLTPDELRNLRAYTEVEERIMDEALGLPPADDDLEPEPAARRSTVDAAKAGDPKRGKRRDTPQ